MEFYYENDLSTKLVEPLLEEIAQASGVHLYTVWELFLIQAAKPARGRGANPARSGEEGAAPTGGLNGAQRTAASAEEATVAVLAGPGTGKPHTLVERVAGLV